MAVEHPPTPPRPQANLADRGSTGPGPNMNESAALTEYRRRWFVEIGRMRKMEDALGLGPSPDPATLASAWARWNEQEPCDGGS